MAEGTQSNQSAVVDSFNEHLRAFYDSLPADEQALWQQVVRLAADGPGDGGDTQGYIIFVGGDKVFPKIIYPPVPLLPPG